MTGGLLTYEDLATHWGVCPRQVKRLCKRHKIPAIILGHRTVRFRPADIELADEKLAYGSNPTAKRRAARC